jgi:hypothetical protein
VITSFCFTEIGGGGKAKLPGAVIKIFYVQFLTQRREGAKLLGLATLLLCAFALNFFKPQSAP